ncbi:MAG: 50S ribosomal protein L2 [bacterium]
MAIKVYKPTSAGRRNSSVLLSNDLTKNVKPIKGLIISGKNQSGRNNYGKITVRHHGGGARKKVRVIDFKRDKFDIPATILTIEYDPNRNTRIALVAYEDGEKRYMVVPQGLKEGDRVTSSKKLIDLKVGNQMPLEVIPPGMVVYNVELTPGKGGQLARSAGAAIYLMGIDNGMAQLKMPSGEVRLVSTNCLAAIGTVGNEDYKNIRWGKAGRTRHRKFRPTVRGKAMNPPDHPHGGGEGRNPIGLKYPKTKWGKPALGVKTRDPKKKSSQFILVRRKNKSKRK